MPQTPRLRFDARVLASCWGRSAAYRRAELSERDHQCARDGAQRVRAEMLVKEPGGVQRCLNEDLMRGSRRGAQMAPVADEARRLPVCCGGGSLLSPVPGRRPSSDGGSMATIKTESSGSARLIWPRSGPV